MKNELTGTGVALVTPFNENRSIDFEGLEKLVLHQIENGMDYLVVMGTTGESPTISEKEQQQILDKVLETNAGKLPVVFGMGGNNTAALVQRLREINLDGVSAVLSASPYYNKPNQEGIFLHYSAVAEASSKPIILYNVPGRTGSNISVDTVLRLAKHPNIVGIKEASGNVSQCMELINNKPADFLVISGDDDLTLPFLSLGMDGVISVIANAYPRECSDMVRSGLKNNYDEARRLHYRLLPMIRLIFEDGSPGGIKLVLENMGICKNYLRLPLAPVKPDVRQAILKTSVV